MAKANDWHLCLCDKNTIHSSEVFKKKQFTVVNVSADLNS